MSYTVRYGRVYNLGNYESERIELERQFEDTVALSEALKALKEELKTSRPK